MSKVWRFGLVLIAAACSSFSHAIEVRSNGADVFVNEVRIHTFLTTFESKSPAQQAIAAVEVLKKYKPGDLFTKQATGQSWVVRLGPQRILTITPEEAKLRKITAQTLAATVTQRLIDSVGLLSIAVDRAAVTMAPGTSTTIKLSGSASASAAVQVSQPAIVKIERTPGQLVLRSLTTGQATIVVSSGSTSVAISVSILPYAFNPTKVYQCSVAGQPADQNTVAGAVATALQAGHGLPAGVKVWAKVLDALPLGPGQSRTVTAKVKASGAGYFGFEGTVGVKVSNISAGSTREDELWYSNEPENIERPCQLYWAKLGLKRTSRLLFHHLNGYQSGLVVRYLIANPSELPAVMTVSMGESRPDKNPTRAGYIAGDLFFAQWVTKSAEVLTIPPRSVIPLSLRRLNPQETSSGLATLSLLSGGPDGVIVVGDAVLPLMLTHDWLQADNVNGAWHSARPRGIETMRLKLEGEPREVFLDPFRTSTMDYEAGGKFGFARIGESPLTDVTSQRSLAGNFGVVYDITGTLRNPTASPVEVELLFEASAGYGSGLFFVNGDYIKLGMINPKQEIVLTSIKLPPGAVKPLRIQTIPLSGANYPVTLIVRPTGFELKAHLGR